MHLLSCLEPREPRRSVVATLSSSVTQSSSRRTNSGAQIRGREGPQLDKHSQCVTIPVCAQEGAFWCVGGWGVGERVVTVRAGVTVKPLVPPALCTVLIHPSQTSSNHRAPSLSAGASQQAGGPPHGRVNCQARLHESTRPSYKTNKGVTGPSRSGNLFHRAGLTGNVQDSRSPRRPNTVSCRRSY